MSNRFKCAVAALMSIAATGTALASGGKAKAHSGRVVHAELATQLTGSNAATGTSTADTGMTDPTGTDSESGGPDRPGSEASTSESDGPGGHTDAVANADHQFQGEE